MKVFFLSSILISSLTTYALYPRLVAYYEYIGNNNMNITMLSFDEYILESRNYDNQGYAESLIKEIQSLLVKQGFLAPTLYNGNDAIDGKFGQATTGALSKFQIANNLVDSKGMINSETLVKLGISEKGKSVPTEQLNNPKITKEDIDGLGNFTPSRFDSAPLIVVYGGIEVRGRESGEYMYDYFDKTENRYNLFVAKNHRVNGYETYTKLQEFLKGENIYPNKKVLYLFSGGFRPGMTLLDKVSPEEFEKIYLVDIYIGKNASTANFYTKLAKQYPAKVEYYYTGSSTQAGGSVNLPAKNTIISSVFISKQGNNHMSTNEDAVASLLATFR